MRFMIHFLIMSLVAKPILLLHIAQYISQRGTTNDQHFLRRTELAFVKFLEGGLLLLLPPTITLLHCGHMAESHDQVT